jgi:hypothetical protein
MEKVTPVKIEIKSVDLDLTLYPSFVLSIFNQLNGTYVKAAGRKKGCRMKVEGKFLLTECEEALYWSLVYGGAGLRGDRIILACGSAQRAVPKARAFC